MKTIYFLFLVICCPFITPACSRNTGMELDPLVYDSIPVSRAVVPMINEASGIADSKRNVGMLWVEEDSGNPTQLYLLGHDGKVVKQVFVKGVVNRDWEDICLAADKIYIGDIGDNAQVYNECVIYRMDEPPSSVDTIDAVESIRFKYSDGPRNAEAFLVDGVSKDIFIITKTDNPARIYKINYPYSTTGLNTAMQVGTLTYSGIVGAALSPDGREIILKTYIGLQYFKRGAGQSISDALKNKFSALTYKPEPQGEAVCFAADGSGFFTLSEKGFGSVVNLYFYPKK